MHAFGTVRSILTRSHYVNAHLIFVLQVLGTVSLPSSLPGLCVAAWLSVTERRRVSAIARLLNQLPIESTAVVTSADTLLTELFSHRGKTALGKDERGSIFKRNPRGCVYVCV